MCTSTVAVADALPEQPEIAIDDSTVDRSGIATSVPFVPEHPPPPDGLTVQVNCAEPVLAGLELSVAVTVTLYVFAVVGVPEINPVEELIDRPAGRPEADHEYGEVP